MATERRLVAVVVEVADLGQSVALYRDGFGIDLHAAHLDDDDRWIGGPHAAFSWSDGASLHFALYQAKRAEETTTGVQIAFAVSDIDDAHRNAVAAGATVIHDPIVQPGGTSARYLDFDGNVIELIQLG